MDQVNKVSRDGINDKVCKRLNYVDLRTREANGCEGE